MFPKGKSSYGLFNLFCLLFNKQFKFEILCLCWSFIGPEPGGLESTTRE